MKFLSRHQDIQKCHISKIWFQNLKVDQPHAYANRICIVTSKVACHCWYAFSLLCSFHLVAQRDAGIEVDLTHVKHLKGRPGSPEIRPETAMTADRSDDDL